MDIFSITYVLSYLKTTFSDLNPEKNSSENGENYQAYDGVINVTVRDFNEI